MGRKTYELAMSQGSVLKSMGKAVVVISTTLDPLQHPDATIVATDVANAIAQLKRQPGKDIWLFGGGALFRTMLDAGLVDRVELAVSPILLGSGVPADQIAGMLEETPESLDAVPLLVRAFKDAGLEAPATADLGALIEGRLGPEEWVASVRARKPGGRWRERATAGSRG